MTYVWHRWLADDFRAAGLTVIEVEGWKDRGRPASTGSFAPDGAVTVHHTGSTSTASNPGPTLRTLIVGRPDLPGPLCHWSVRRDGVVVVIAAGRANHAGRIDANGVLGMPVGGDGNAHALGDEVDCNGTQPLTSEQRHAIAVTNKVVTAHWRRPSSWVHRHKDIAPARKWDLGELNTSELRADVDALTDAPTGDWFDMADKADLTAAIQAAIPAITAAVTEAVLDAPVENANRDGSKTTTTLRKIITNIELDGDKISEQVTKANAQLAEVLALAKSGESAGA